MRLMGRMTVVLAAAIVCGLLLVRSAYLPWRCNAVVSRVTGATELAITLQSDYERLVLARRNLEELAGIRAGCEATEVRVPMLTAANQEIIGRAEDAIRSYDQALRVDQRPEIYIARAEVEISLGRLEDAVNSYTIAARLSPPIVENIGSEELRRRVGERIRASR